MVETTSDLKPGLELFYSSMGWFEETVPYAIVRGLNILHILCLKHAEEFKDFKIIYDYMSKVYTNKHNLIEQT